MYKPYQGGGWYKIRDAKFTELYRQGKSYREIAEQYGYAEQTVSRLIRHYIDKEEHNG
jgi:transposase